MSRPNDVDYLLIGSGVAAASIATRLLEIDPCTSILMLEAGDRIPARDRGLWWDYVTTGQLPYDYTYDTDNPDGDTSGPGQTSIGNLYWPMNKMRVTAMGGTTMHWGGWALRMKPEDFELKTLTNQGADWPIGYPEIEPYYCEAERFLSVGGDGEGGDPPRSRPLELPPYPWQQADLAMKAAFEAKGLETGRLPLARYRRCMTTGTCRYCPVGARFSAQYVNEELENGPYPNFELRTGATVNRLVLDSRKRVKGAEYADRYNNNEPVTVTAQTVIVCAGAFESPKLLMRSTGAGHETGLGEGRDLLGRYLVSHSFLSVKAKADANPGRITAEYGFPTLMSRSYDDPSRQATGKVLLFRDQNSPYRNWQSLMQAGKDRTEMDRIATGEMVVGLSAFYEEFGRYENRITLNGSRKDQFGLPLMKIDFNRDKAVEKNAAKRLEEMKELMRAMEGFDYVDKSASLEGAAGYHASGTCRMGTDPSEGVTDENLQVFGLENLYVCSNAVFPSIGAVNPTLTLTALAFRLADHLAGRAPLPPTEFHEAQAQ